MSHPDIHEGRDGWLFLIGGSNDVAKMFAEDGWISRTDGETWRHLLQTRAINLSARDIQYVHLWVPDKLSIYREFVTDQSLFLPLAPMDIVRSHGDWSSLATIYLDIRDEMQSAKNQKLLYWKTDTHWTYQGACAAYRAICRKLNAAPIVGIEDRPTDQVELALDLGSKLNPKVLELWSIAKVLNRSRVVHKNELVKLQEIMKPMYQGVLHTGTSVRYECKAKDCDPRRVLLFGDSFSEHRAHLLSGLLGETFAEFQFVWSSSLDYALIDRFKPDIVITEMAERFLKQIPTDKFDLEGFAFERLASFLAPKCSGDNVKWTITRL